jgi:hypothetical protein
VPSIWQAPGPVRPRGPAGRSRTPRLHEQSEETPGYSLRDGAEPGVAEPTVSAAEPGDMNRRATWLRLSLILAIRRLMSWPLDFDISLLTRRTSAKLFIRVRHVLPRHKAANWVGPGRGRKSTRPGANGVVELSTFEFLDQLADHVPPPRKHRHRYHGVFTPNHKLRPAVTALATGNVAKRGDAATDGHAVGGHAASGGAIGGDASAPIP